MGGGSRRMGQAKALLEVAGTPMATRVARVLERTLGRVVLVGEGPVPAELEGLDRVPDAVLGPTDGAPAPGRQGPLAGILGALRAEREAAWVLCPCDLPRVEDGAVRWLLEQRGEGIVAVLPRVAGEGTGRDEVQPLFALYEAAARPLLEALVATGRRGPRHLEGQPGVASPRVPPSLAAAWTDADTPADLEAARRRRE